MKQQTIKVRVQFKDAGMKILAPFVLDKDGKWLGTKQAECYAQLTGKVNKEAILVLHDRKFFMNCEADGLEEPLFIPNDFIDMEEGIVPITKMFDKNKLYSLETKEGNMVTGLYQGVTYSDGDLVHSIMTFGTTTEIHYGTFVQELSDEQLSMMNTTRLEYYGEK